MSAMLTPGADLGGYRIERVLGHGGMGVVYEAVQLSLRRTVALKVLSAELSADPLFRERFRREGRLQASIEHPNIVTVYEAGEIDGSLFLAMRLIHGQTLKDLIRKGPLEPRQAIGLLEPLAEALDAAHRAGLIHRDVKPQNILIDSEERPFLADFGLTKAPGETSGLTRTGHFMGTATYVAPELIKGEDATPASDIYSFTAVLFESLTGRVPYRRGVEAAVLHAHLSEPPPQPSEVRPELAAAFDEVVGRGMAKEPAARPATATALVAGAMQALEATPATAVLGEPSRAATGTEATIATAPILTEGRNGEEATETTTAPLARSAPLRQRTVGPRLIAAALALVVVAVGAIALFGGGGDPPEPDVLLGSRFTLHEGQAACSGNPGERPSCTIVQRALPGATLKAPFDGVITAWRLRGAKGSFRIRVMSSAGEPLGASETATVDGGLAEFRTELPIDPGQTVALEVAEGGTFGITFAQGAKYALWDPPLADGEARSPSSRGDLEVLYNADLVRD